MVHKTHIIRQGVNILARDNQEYGRYSKSMYHMQQIPTSTAQTATDAAWPPETSLGDNRNRYFGTNGIQIPTSCRLLLKIAQSAGVVEYTGWISAEG